MLIEQPDVTLIKRKDYISQPKETLPLTQNKKHGTTSDMETIMQNHPKEDFAEIDFGDKRLNKRLQQFVENATKNADKSILGSGKGRSEAKGFYRLLGNERFDMEQMAGVATGATLSRMSGTVLLIQDTSDINLNGHKKTEGLGYCSEHVRGIKLHSCIAVSPEGIPFGLVSQAYGTRPEAKSGLTRAEKAARGAEEKESHRWIETLRDSTDIIPDGVHFITVCDREGDFYELYAEAEALGMDFIIRVTHDRRSDANERTAAKIRQAKALGNVTVNIPRDSRRGVPAREATMEVASCQASILKPSSVRGDETGPKLSINLVRITELDPPDGQEPIEWIIATSLPILTASDAFAIVGHYVQRWKIERFHYVLKSGMGAENIQQRTYERIKPVLFIYSVIALYIMAVTYMGRIAPDAPCTVFFDDDEWKILYCIANKKKTAPDEPYSMADAVKYLGQLGGYKRSPSDGAPGLKSIWDGLLLLYFAVDVIMGQG
jgi:hypothetical protein